MTSQPWKRRVVLGDGRVVLYEGDCLEILPHLEGVDAVVTDPPYGVSHLAGSGRRAKLQERIANDHEPPDVRWISKYPCVIWGGNNFAPTLPRSTGWLVWDKTHGALCQHSQAELAYTNCVRTIRVHREAYHGFMRARDGWLHPTQKSPALMRWCVEFMPNATTILDPFMGSGTTGVAAVQLGRRFIGIELEPKYFDIALERITHALAQPRLFDDEPAPTQEALL